MTRTFEVTDSCITLTAVAVEMGSDLLLSVTGGEKPHIGSASVSVPRPSLADPEAISSTTSTINMTGHKDNAVGDMISARLCATLNTNVVVVCGIHIDGIQSQEINRILACGETLMARIAEAYRRPK